MNLIFLYFSRIALPSGKKLNVLQFGSIKNPKGFGFISFLSTQEVQFLRARGSDVPHMLSFCRAFVDASHSSPSFMLLLDVL